MLDLNDETFEKLSALADGELSDFETRQLLKQIDQLQPEQRADIYAYWQRVHVVSECLTSERAIASSSLAFVDAVSKAVSQEYSAVETDEDFAAEESAAADQASAIEYLKPAATSSLTASDRDEHSASGEKAAAPSWSKFAVAASVALAVIVGFQQVQISDQNQLLASANKQVQSEALVASSAVSATPVAASPMDSQQAELLAQIEAAGSAEEQLSAQQRLIDYLTERPQQATTASDPFARVANFEEESAAAEAQQ